ncbi:MAG: pitrilysin family protein, partial [Pseudomonadota bacterium]
AVWLATASRVPSTLRARGVDETIEDLGGSLNASTTHQRTAFYARVRAEDVPVAVEILSDIVREPHLDERDVATEREIVLQEIDEALETGEDVCLDRLQEAAFGSTPLARSVLGTRDAVASHTAERLRAFIARAYAAEACVLAVSGGFDADAARRAAERGLGAWPHARAAAPVEPASFVGGERDFALGERQGHLALAFPGPAATDALRPAARVLSELLGGGVSSRLNRKIREEAGLAYTVYSFYDPYADTGALGAYAAGDPDDLDDIEAIMRAELADLAAGPGGAELRRARAQLVAGALMSRESLASRAEAAANDVLTFGRPLGETEIEQRVAAVTDAEIAEVARAALAGPAARSVVAPRST